MRRCSWWCSFVPLLVENPAVGGLVLECALLGLPAGCLLAAWGRALGREPIARSVPEVFLGSALGAAACFACAVVPVAGAVLVLKLLPLGSAAALRRLLAGPPVSVLAPAEGAATLLSGKIVAGTAVFGLAAGFMETYGSDPGMATTPTFPVTLFLFVLFCIAALQLFGGGGGTPAEDIAPAEGQGPLDGSYRLAVLLMMAGFLFVPVLADFGVPGEAIVLAGYLGLSAVLVSLFLVMGRITGQDAALSFARGFTALFAGEMAGIALGNLLDLVGTRGQTPYAVVACAGLAALFAYLFLFTERDFRSLSVAVRDTDRFEEACRLVAEEAGLSRREAEILPLALKGRTGERIAAEFYISKSTVDTHLRRIYQKCGVHGRQELIDLGERTERRLAGRDLESRDSGRPEAPGRRAHSRGFPAPCVHAHCAASAPRPACMRTVPLPPRALRAPCRAARPACPAVWPASCAQAGRSGQSRTSGFASGPRLCAGGVKSGAVPRP